jgi:hypothetical protein
MLADKRHASFCWCVIIACDVQKNRAAPALRTRNIVNTKHRYDIVKTIVAPKPLTTGRVGQLHEAIVIGVSG